MVCKILGGREKCSYDLRGGELKATNTAISTHSHTLRGVRASVSLIKEHPVHFKMLVRLGLTSEAMR